MTLAEIVRCNANFSDQINLRIISSNVNSHNEISSYKEPFYSSSIPSATTLLGKCLEYMTDC